MWLSECTVIASPSLLCAMGSIHARFAQSGVRSASVELARGDTLGDTEAADCRQHPWFWQGSRWQAALGR